jgi:ABC-type phosphate transport system permease subunit
MNTEERKMFEALKHIQKVEPSTTLFSKIENRIKEEQSNTISMSKLMAASVVLIVLIASNTLLVRKELKQNKNTTNQNELVEAFDINTTNQLYNE